MRENILNFWPQKEIISREEKCNLDKTGKKGWNGMECRGQKRILLSKSTHTDSCVHGLAYVHQKLLLCGWNVTCKHHFVVVILMQRHDLLPFIVHKIRSLPQNNRRWHEMTSTVIVSSAYANIRMTLVYIYWKLKKRIDSTVVTEKRHFWDWEI